jgi:serralysin
MLGGSGDDTLRSSAGDDAVEGGAGLDTYVLSIGRSGFVVTSPAEGVFVIRPTPGGLGGSFGTDTVAGVESFTIVSSTGTMTMSAGEMLARFNDGGSQAPTEGSATLPAGADATAGPGGNEALEGGEAMQLAAPKAFADEHEARATRLYDTVFDRAPDRSGLDYWSSALRQGYSLDTIADLFITAPEFQTRYGAPDNREFVGQLYRNVLDREGEAGGMAWWTDILNRGLADRSDVVQGFSEAAEHVAKVTAADYLP